jgi:hypothetical protein
MTQIQNSKSEVAMIRAMAMSHRDRPEQLACLSLSSSALVQDARWAAALVARVLLPFEHLCFGF